jgi:hypothetical protein
VSRIARKQTTSARTYCSDDRLEKFVANILRRYNEVYSKLKQFVAAVLSDNKILLSTPFVALPIL